MRTRLYFCHNSHLQGLLLALVAGPQGGRVPGPTGGDAPTAAPASSEAQVPAGALGSDDGHGGGGGAGAGGDIGAGVASAVERVLSSRLSFLAHCSLRLSRRRGDGALRVACEFAASSSGETIQLFDLPFASTDAWFSELLTHADGLEADPLA